MKRLLFLIVSLIPLGLCGQEIHFSQFYNAPLFLNPALTGNSDCGIRLGTVYRNQWKSIDPPYKTFHVFVDARVTPRFMRRDWLGVGLFAYSDKAGEGNLRTTNTMLCLSYNKPLAKADKVVFSIGLAGGITNRDVNTSGLTFGNQWDGTTFSTDLPNGETYLRASVFHMDFNAGMLLTWAAKKDLTLHLGASVNHLTRPEETFFVFGNKLSRKSVIHAGFSKLTRSYKFLWMPKVYLSMQDHTYELVAGTNFKFVPGKEVAHIGLWYRWGRDIIPTLGFNVKGFAFAFSYDFNVSKLRKTTASNGGFELSLIKTFNCKTKYHKKNGKKESTYKNRSGKYEGCPAF